MRVYNAAVSAYSTAHSLIRLEFDILQYERDLVIVMHNVNDLTVNYFAPMLSTTRQPASSPSARPSLKSSSRSSPVPPPPPARP